MPSLPILYSAHHCSASFGEWSARVALDEERRKRLSDCGTDRTVPLHGRALFATHSRGVIDLNRPLSHMDLFRDADFADPPNRIWHPWQEPTPAEQEDIIRRIYRPYHDRLLRCLQELSRGGRPVLVVAWDNMGRYPLREDGSVRPGSSPPIILSNCGEKGSCDAGLLSALAGEFRAALLACGFSADTAGGMHFNLPGFKGGYICEHYTTRRHPDLPVDVDVQSLQVEYDIAITHDPYTLEADDDAIRRFQRAFSLAMERTYADCV